jgi:hypothetical protein
MSVGAESTLYLPITTGSEGTSNGYLFVVPSSQSMPYKITNGLSFPWAAASGD